MSDSVEIEATVSREVGLALTIIPCITGAISFFSSAYLIWSILSGTKKHRGSDGILVGLSCLNLIFSAACSMSTFAAPEELDPFEPYILRGTIATCEMQGWLYQAGTSVPMYNAFLSIYYFLRVNFKRTDQDLRKYALPAMHATVLLWSFGSATAGLMLNIFNFGGLLGCWIHHDYGGYCAAGIDLQSCGRESNHELFLWLFGAGPVLLSLVVTIAATTAMYCAVRNQELATSRHGQQQHTGAVTSDSLESPEAESDDNQDANIATNAVPVSTTSQHEQPPTTTYWSLWDQFCRCGLSSAINHKISARVRDSGLLYVVAFWVTYLPTMLLKILFLAGRQSPDWLRFSNVILLPLQGLFNVLIYKTPRCQYLQTQRANTRSSAISSREDGRRPHLLSSTGQDLQEQLPRAAATTILPDGMPSIVNISSKSIGIDGFQSCKDISNTRRISLSSC